MTTGYGKYTPEAYGKAYANQQRRAYQGTTGRQNLGVSNQEYKGGKTLDLSGLGGLLAGRGGGADAAYDDLQRQLEYDKTIWERSTPNVKGVGGSVTWDRDTNTVSSALNEQNQKIYDDMLKRQGMFGGQVDFLASGGWEDAQAKRFSQLQALYKDQDDEERLRIKESNYNTGASLTEQKMDELTRLKGIDNRELGLLNQAFAESQALIDSNRERQYGDITAATNLGTVANNLIKTPTPYPQGNMQNVSTASTRWADNLAMQSAKKQKGMSDMWSSILGGSSLFSV
jgi:hypothetical protein